MRPTLTVLMLGAAWGVAQHRSRGRTRAVQQQIAALDPVTDARQMVWLLATRELAFDTELSLSLALFRTYAVPSISVLLEATGEFTSAARKRYDDTELIIAEMSKHGVATPGPGRDALRRMNAMHAAYDIDLDDTLYTLTTFICEPVRWAARFGWRAMTAAEVAAQTRWYAEVGSHMGLGDLPTDYAWFDRFNRRYEAERFAFHPANRIVADASVQLLLDIYLPPVLHRVGALAVRAMLDQPLREALGYQPAPPAMTAVVEASLRARAFVQRHLMPERRTDWDLTTVARATYPGGHRVAQLGTFPGGAARIHANAALAALRAAPGGSTEV
ncbi:MAG: hypothetical protein ACI970_000580 [Myxococcota bacterium]|jgi:hypothetical protein